MIVQNPEMVIQGRFFKVARLRNESYDEFASLEVELARAAALKGDVFTFVEKFPYPEPSGSLDSLSAPIAVLDISTFDHWWKNQISDKTRNMARKAGKKGVEIRVIPFNEELIHGIMGIHNESPVRQGRRFLHYGKDFETTKRDHISYCERSEFIGAFLGPELIGFIKLTHREGISNLMQIISKVGHRDKAPNNALLAKAVEICAQKKIPYLQYGSWSRRGLGEFKKNHGFRLVDRQRFFVPINWKGKLLLGLQLHRKWSNYLPDSMAEKLGTYRDKWNSKLHVNRLVDSAASTNERT